MKVWTQRGGGGGGWQGLEHPQPNLHLPLHLQGQVSSAG